MKVTLVGKTEFIKPDHIDFETDADGGQALAEFAGRACYQSFHKPNPATATNAGYLAHILEVGHECYDEKTEVLTEDGWKAWPDVEPADALATRSATGHLEYHRPLKLFAAPYSGRMVRVESSGVDLLVTPNHRMLACRTTTRRGRRKQDFELIPAEELVEVSHAYVKTATWTGGQPSITEDEARFLGFFIGDGNLGPGSLRPRFHLRRERKVRWLKAICSQNDWRLTSSDDRFTVVVPAELALLLRQCYGEGSEKQLPPGLITQLDQSRAAALLDGLMESDGSKSGTAWCYDTTSRGLADQVQQLALHAGLASNLGYEVPPSAREIRGVEFHAVRPIRRQHIIRRNLRPEVNKFSGMAGKTYWAEYTGMVYCATVPNHTLYVRRNGIPVWSGNSVLEHGVVSFYIEGISRSLTHELVRHRHFSYSQLSQRFVTGAEFVVPPAIKDDPELREVFESTLAVIEHDYNQLLDTLDAKLKTSFAGTGRRKAARQAARSVLPNATETKIVVTGNYRTWRHFVALRGTVHADVEIRALAVECLRQLWEIAPSVFSDLVIVTFEDGTEGVENEAAWGEC